jgi:hypothetical protein
MPTGLLPEISVLLLTVAVSWRVMGFFLISPRLLRPLRFNNGEYPRQDSNLRPAD